jgi:hypothetical protein
VKALIHGDRRGAPDGFDRFPSLLDSLAEKRDHSEAPRGRLFSLAPPMPFTAANSPLLSKSPLTHPCTRHLIARSTLQPERWLSGRKRRFAKALYGLNRTEGSNPSLSASSPPGSLAFSAFRTASWLRTLKTRVRKHERQRTKPRRRFPAIRNSPHHLSTPC